MDQTVKGSETSQDPRRRQDCKYTSNILIQLHYSYHPSSTPLKLKHRHSMNYANYNLGKMAPSTTRIPLQEQHQEQLISSDQKPIKEPSTPAFVLSIDLANHVVNGRGADSKSKASLAITGSYLDGPHHPRSLLWTSQRTLLQAVIVARRTRTAAKSRVRRAIVV